MPLDPVHVDGINSLARRIRDDYDDPDDSENIDALWEFLDPLRDGGGSVFEPIDELKKRAVSLDGIALADDEFPTHHGVDAGTLNPRSFTNGLTLDVAHTAAASVPSDLSLHRKRTIVTAVQSSDHSVVFEDSWDAFDEASADGRVVQAPRDTDNARESAHVFALYLSESTHLGKTYEEADDLLYLDGPLYPLGLLRWHDIDPTFGRSDLTGEIASNYFGTYERALEDSVPVVGFVKNPSCSRVVRRLRDIGPPVPWSNDAGFFRHFLTPEAGEGAEKEGAGGDLTFTNWFVSRFYADELFEIAPELETERDDLLPAVMYVHDPRHGTVHRAEAPLGFVRDEETREEITRQTLKEVALSRVPRAVAKADALARVTNDQRESLVRRFEEALGTVEETTYDRDRWGYVRSSTGLTL
ncbi:MAG: DNA double-strand break repair nuclease NurA [Halobacteriales archaeon]|nr:DNA double-strand break repair nuclease NurA [Halobacteriales archaeon]